MERSPVAFWRPVFRERSVSPRIAPHLCLLATAFARQPRCQRTSSSRTLGLRVERYLPEALGNSGPSVIFVGRLDCPMSSRCCQPLTWVVIRAACRVGQSRCCPAKRMQLDCLSSPCELSCASSHSPKRSVGLYPPSRDKRRLA